MCGRSLRYRAGFTPVDRTPVNLGWWGCPRPMPGASCWGPTWTVVKAERSRTRGLNHHRPQRRNRALTSLWGGSQGLPIQRTRSGLFKVTRQWGGGGGVRTGIRPQGSTSYVLLTKIHRLLANEAVHIPAAGRQWTVPVYLGSFY